MPNAELNVTLNADAKQFAVALQRAEKNVHGLENELDQLKPALDTVDKSLNKTASEVKKTAASTGALVKSVKLTEASFKGLPRHVNASSQTLLNFGRIAQDAPFGILGIANNINPLLESFQRLKNETGSTKTALKSLVTGLTGAGGLGIAVSVVSSLLIVFADKLFGTATASKASEVALKSFGDALERIKDGVKSLNDELQFSKQLGDLNIKITGGTDLRNLREQSILQRTFTTTLEKERDKLKLIGEKIANDANLNAKDRIDAELKYFDSLKTINAEIRDSQQTQTLIYRKIALQRVEDIKKGNEDAIKANDKFIEATIARARRLASFLTRTTIRFVPFEVDPEATKGEQFTQALDFIKKALTQRFEFSLKPQILIENPTLIKAQSYFSTLQAEAAKILKDLQDEITRLTKTNPIIIEANRVEKERQDRFAELHTALGLSIPGINAPLSLLTEMQKAAVNAANTLNSVLAPAFDGLFAAIKAGENPIKGFFQGLMQSVAQLIQKLISAIAVSLILNAIFPALGGKEAAFGIFKSLMGFKAQGGPVLAGRPYVVGEQGPELFIPGRSGRIATNQQMNGLAGVTGGPLHITVDGRIRGRELRLVNARQQGFENRNV